MAKWGSKGKLKPLPQGAFRKFFETSMFRNDRAGHHLLKRNLLAWMSGLFSSLGEKRLPGQRQLTKKDDIIFDRKLQSGGLVVF